MTLTKNHPMDTVMTPTNNHPTTRTNHILTDTILISHHTMDMKNLMRNHTNQSMKKSHTNLNTSRSHTMIMKNLLTRIHMNQNTNQNMNQSRTNQNMKNLLTRNHTNINM